MFHFHQKKKEMEHSCAFFFFLWKSTILPCCLLSSILSRHMVTLVGFVLSFWLHWGLSPSCLWFVLFQEQEADQLNALKSKPLRRSEIKPNSPGHNWRWLTIQCFYSNCKGFLDNYFTHTVIQREQSRYCMCTYIKGYKEKENRVHIVSFVTPFFEKKKMLYFLSIKCSPSWAINPIIKIIIVEISVVVQWLRLCLPMQGVWVWSLVGKLRSHMLQGQKPKT